MVGGDAGGWFDANEGGGVSKGIKDNSQCGQATQYKYNNEMEL